jgi:hypothetical protein
LPESSNNRSLKSSRRWNSAIKNLSALESGDIRSPSPDFEHGQKPNPSIDPAGSNHLFSRIRSKWPDSPESGQNGWDLIGSRVVRLEFGHFGRIRPNLLTESCNGNQTLPDSGDSHHTLIFAFHNFFVRAKRRKIFSRKLIFLKIILPKIFYDGNHLTSNQTEHKSN